MCLIGKREVYGVKILLDPLNMLRSTKFLLVVSLILIGLGLCLGVISLTSEPYSFREVLLYSLTETSRYSIEAYTIPNDIYEDIAVPLSPEKTVYLHLVREILVNHTYEISKGSFSGIYNVTVELVHPDGWSKKYSNFSIPLSRESRVEKSIVLNISDIVSLMDKLCKQASVKLTDFDIVITSSVDPYIFIDSYTRDESPLTHTITICVSIARNRVEVRGDLSLTSVIEEKRSIREPLYVFGLTVEALRVIASSTTVSGVIGLIAYIVLYTRSRKLDIIRDFESKYSELIVESRKIIGRTSSTKIEVSSLEELVKTARLLEKPIVKITSGNNCTYMVVDKDITYVFTVRGVGEE